MSEEIKTIEGSSEWVQQRDGSYRRVYTPDMLVLPDGITINKDAVEAMVDNDIKNTERTILPEEMKRRLDNQRRWKENEADMRDLLASSKKVTEAIVRQSDADKVAFEDMARIMKDASEREVDCGQVFVNVTDKTPVEAARKVLDTHVSDLSRVVPIDLSNVLEQTKQCPNTEVTEITHMISVAQPQENVPNVVLFAVPGKETDILSEPDMRIERYVSMGNMPTELRNVVQSYLSMGKFPGSVKSLKGRVRALLEALESLPED